MESLTHQEQLALYIGIFSMIIILFQVIFISPSNNLKWFFLGGSVSVISALLIYVFVIQPVKTGQKIYRRRSRFSRSDYSDFRPNVIRPSGRVKKTIMEGKCHFCNKSALMGFTCSYCNGYFCPDHRLPEKHDCLGLRNR
ncbi:MAG: AN1-type zinc finger domain-containing protein [Candidatus Hodarchaeota archaeon]